jgi:protein-S-isoprenylcysteine O-methyltransferase Ste14
MEQFEDRLELIGLGVGALLVLIGLGTLVGQPWTQTLSTLAWLGQVVGAVLAIGIGAGLVWLTRTETPQVVAEPEEPEDADAA